MVFKLCIALALLQINALYVMLSVVISNFSLHSALHHSSSFGLVLDLQDAHLVIY